MEKDSPWADLGITGESRYLNSFFEPHSRNIVVQFGRLVTENVGIKSLYLRSVNEKTYRRLSAASERLSYEDVVLTPDGPSVLVNIFDVDSSHATADWHSLQKIQLPGGKVVLEVNQLESQAPGCRAWISRLVGVSNDGETVFCNIGIQNGSERVRYYLVHLNPNTKRYELITELTHIYL